MLKKIYIRNDDGIKNELNNFVTKLNNRNKSIHPCQK